MTTHRISPLVLRQRLAEWIDEVRETEAALVVEHGHKPAAVVLGYDRTLDLLARAKAAAAKAGDAEGAALFAGILSDIAGAKPDA